MKCIWKLISICIKPLSVCIQETWEPKNRETWESKKQEMKKNGTKHGQNTQERIDDTWLHTRKTVCLNILATGNTCRKHQGRKKAELCSDVLCPWRVLQSKQKNAKSYRPHNGNHSRLMAINPWQNTNWSTKYLSDTQNHQKCVRIFWVEAKYSTKTNWST